MKKKGLLTVVFALVFLAAPVFGQGYKNYVVKPGDTWAKLAVIFEISIEELAEANSRNAKDILFAGEGIKIPLSEEISSLTDEISKTAQSAREENAKVRKILLWSFLTFFSAFFLVIILFLLKSNRNSKKAETKEERVVIRVKFENGNVFAVNCDKVSKMILCPICDFINDSPFRVAKHLKGHFKKNEKLDLFQKVAEVNWKLGILAATMSGFFLAAGCSSYIMPEKKINEPVTVVEAEYNVLWCGFSPVLLMSEGIGSNHELHLDKEKFLGIKYRDESGRFFLLAILPAEVDIKKARGIVSSRSGRYFYSVDGKSIFSADGYLAPKFSWFQIKPLAESGIEIWQNILPNSEKDKKIKAILAEIGKDLDKKKIPGVFDRAMSRVAKITQQDVILAGATNFSSLFAVFGIRAWVIVETIIQQADLSLPFYDSAPVDRFQLALSLEPFQKQMDSLSDEQEKALNIWLKKVGWFEKYQRQYEEEHREWLEKKREYEQAISGSGGGK